MARKPRSRVFPVGPALALGAIVLGAGFFWRRSAAAATTAASFEQTMMSRTTPEGQLFLVWLVMFRAGLVTAPLVIGDAAGNNRLIESGIRAAGVDPAATVDVTTRAVCTAYKTAQLHDALRPLPEGSAAFQAYMGEVIAQFSATCLSSGINLA